MAGRFRPSTWMSVTGTRPPAAATARRRRMAAVLLLLGAAACTARVLEPVLTTGPDPVRAHVSELAAADRPLLLIALSPVLLALRVARHDRAVRTEPVTEVKEIPHR
ncbi:hypothetical protein [Streptomyces sp. NPDC059649]|uniref:hypothetical protein n=1 Tax=Streptomyces sp. NPDC059649 TaxID=3346895 RepID=UPI0036B1BA08